MKASETGTPPYSPQLKFKIYIYGYFEKNRSSRRLEKECIRNKELIWLINALAPDFKTIADFRKDNNKAFKNILSNNPEVKTYFATDNDCCLQGDKEK